MNNDFDQLPDVDEPVVEAKAGDTELENMRNDEARARNNRVRCDGRGHIRSTSDSKTCECGTMTFPPNSPRKE